MLRVAIAVTHKFLGPESFIASRYGCTPTPGMLVPETAVDENDRTVFRKHEICFPRKLRGMNAESVSHAVQETLDPQLGFGVLSAYCGHDSTSRPAAKSVGHSYRKRRFQRFTSITYIPTTQ
jgi:hypothetical protein